MSQYDQSLLKKTIEYNILESPMDQLIRTKNSKALKKETHEIDSCIVAVKALSVIT